MHSVLVAGIMAPAHCIPSLEEAQTRLFVRKPIHSDIQLSIIYHLQWWDKDGVGGVWLAHLTPSRFANQCILSVSV